jgi:hypothetical protein
VPCKGTQITEVLCEHFERTVGHDNCVSFDAMKLQVPQQRHRCHFGKTKLRVRMLPRASRIMWNSVSGFRSLPARIVEPDAAVATGWKSLAVCGVATYISLFA